MRRYLGFANMLSANRKRILLASALILIALGAAGCRGFFVKPTLTGMTVTTLGSTNLPTQGSTVQLVATGNYDDGSHKNLTGGATWTKGSDPQNLVTLSTTTPGFVTANAAPNPAGQVTIQAAAQSSDGSVVSGTITLSVGQATTLTITSNPASPVSLSAAGGTGSTIQFTATLNGSDVTSTTTFTSSNSSVISITSGSTGTLQGTGTTTITGTDSSHGATGTAQIQVNQ